MNHQRADWEPVEIITAERTGMRVCVFREQDGSYSFELQHRQTSETAGSRYFEQWSNIGPAAMRRRAQFPDTYRMHIVDFGEAMTRAGNALASLVEFEHTVATGDGQRVALGAAVWVRVFDRDPICGTLTSFEDAGTVIVDVPGFGGVVKTPGEVYATEQAARDQ